MTAGVQKQTVQERRKGESVRPKSLEQMVMYTDVNKELP